MIGCFQPFFGFVFGLGMFFVGVTGAILFSDVFFRDVFCRGLFSDVVGAGGIVYNITIQSRLRTFFVGRCSSFFGDFSVVQVFGHLFFNQGLSFFFVSCPVDIIALGFLLKSNVLRRATETRPILWLPTLFKPNHVNEISSPQKTDVGDSKKKWPIILLKSVTNSAPDPPPFVPIVTNSEFVARLLIHISINLTVLL